MEVGSIPNEGHVQSHPEILAHHRGDISFQTRAAKVGSKPVGTRVIVRLPHIEEKTSGNQS